MNRRKLILLWVVLLIIIIGLTVYKNNRVVFAADMVDKNTAILKKTETILFEEFGERNFTCTGLTFDTDKDTFWIADYGAMNSEDNPEPRLIEVNKEWTHVVSTISLNNIVDSNANVQGVCYDSSNESLWFATGDKIINISKEGHEIGSIKLGPYAKYKANGVTYNPTDNSLWVLCYEKYLLNYSKDGHLLSRIKMNLQDQDQIYMLNEHELIVTVGADYNGTNNFIVKVNISSGEISVWYQVVGSYAVEGVCVVDDNLYIANDGLYHNAKIKKSYISIYNL